MLPTINSRKLVRKLPSQKTGGISLRNKELNSEDIQFILYWYEKAFGNSTEDVDKYKKTLIKVQAFAIYAQEEEEYARNFFKRRLR